MTSRPTSALPVAAALAALLAAACPARATVGGPSPIEVLGLTDDGGKLYLLRSPGGESGDPPRALYFRLDLAPGRRAPDAPIVIRSWYRGPEAAAIEERVTRKIAYLRRHLKPLTPAPLEGIELSLRHGGLAPCAVHQEEATAAEIEAALAQARARHRAGQVVGDGPLVSVCRRMDVTVRWDGREARTVLHTWGDVAVRGAWTIPGSEKRLVVLTHTGVTVETGYAEDVALLLPDPE